MFTSTTTSTVTSARTGTEEHAAHRSRWARLLQAVAPSPDRLVTVTEVSRESVRLVEQSLEDVGVRYVLQPVGSLPGTTPRYRVLVAAADRERAAQVVGSH